MCLFLSATLCIQVTICYLILLNCNGKVYRQGGATAYLLPINPTRKLLRAMLLNLSNPLWFSALARAFPPKMHRVTELLHRYRLHKIVGIPTPTTHKTTNLSSGHPFIQSSFTSHHWSHSKWCSPLIKDYCRFDLWENDWNCSQEVYCCC